MVSSAVPTLPLPSAQAAADKGYMSAPFIKANIPVNDEVLNVIAHLPTKSLLKVAEEEFFRKMTDKDFMRLAVLLAQKSYDEGGCPIGGVVVDNASRQIMGKGHNTLIQEGHPYNHGETSAIRDAGRIDFSKTTMFTSLSPCDVCATLLYMRGFDRVVVGDVTSARGNEGMLQQKGVKVDILEDQKGIALYSKYRAERPDQDIEDWKGLAAVHHKHG
jgi:cytosine/creatinine deaminase